MSVNIGNRTFMNLQEAVGWLLENNSLPFQSTANYVGGVEIAMSTLINPSPAKVRVGSIIFFADSKVSTVVGVTSNSFIVSDQYNDLVDDVVYVSNVAINASGHLIVTLSNGNNIDAGLIKQVTGFSINTSQHLIVTYNDGTTTDLGAIFNGNVNISGNFTADSIIENMSGYSFYFSQTANWDYEPIYAGVVKNGNKLTMVVACYLTKREGALNYSINLGYFVVPSAVGARLFPAQIGAYSFLDVKKLTAFQTQTVAVDILAYLSKSSETTLSATIAMATNMVQDTKYYVRYEITMLLSDNLAQ